MEDFEFEVDFGEDIIEVEQPVQEEVQEEIHNNVDPVEQDDTEIIEEPQEEESDEEVDLDTHQLFIEGWRETGMLVLPDNYDATGKTVTEVMADSAKYFNEAIKQNFIENLPEDIQEVARLAIEGKIKNAKEYLSYQVEADKIVDNITGTEEARKFLESYYKETVGLDDDDIEQTLDSLELKDKLIEKATAIKSKVDEKIKQDIELKKQQLLQKEAEEKAAKEKAMSERVAKVKSYIEASNWSNEHKKYVQQEIAQGMKNTVSNIQAAITDPDVTPEFVSLMSRLLVKDSNGKVSLSKESLKEFASTKVAKEIKSSWESKLDKSNLPKIAGKSTRRENTAEVEYDLYDFS